MKVLINAKIMEIENRILKIWLSFVGEAVYSLSIFNFKYYKIIKNNWNKLINICKIELHANL
jgi:uncharacterized membrane protein (Fun14 family)